MKPGDLVPTTYIRAMYPNINYDYKAEKGRRFVFILLGDEPKDGTNPLDPTKRLNELGWFKSEKENKVEEK